MAAATTGPVCEPMHYHGYIGMEAEAVKMISDWIKSPRVGAQRTLPGFMIPSGSRVFLIARMRSSSSALL